MLSSVYENNRKSINRKDMQYLGYVIKYKIFNIEIIKFLIQNNDTKNPNVIFNYFILHGLMNEEIMNLIHELFPGYDL